jgi:hypothetical protein
MLRRRGGSRVSGKGSPKVLLARSNVREALCLRCGIATISQRA